MKYTVITRYSEAYDELFKKATERLKELKVLKKDEQGLPKEGEYATVSSLEEYFSHLHDLIYGNPEDENGQAVQEAGYLFLKLPLDEPAFVIDANSRVITIPQNFVKNGLSVHGDEVAEIVFFEIDRFFDATDLSLQSISIQWEDAAGESNHISAFIRDIESKASEDKLIFGWPITSEVTKNPGKLKFSVHFYTERDNSENPDEKSYSFFFSTLPATIMINEGLKLDPMKVDADNATSLILGRIQNSPLGGVGDATVPQFICYYDPEAKKLKPLSTPSTEIDQVESEIVLAAIANKKDSGTLTYGWYHDEDGSLTGNSHDNWKTPLIENYGAYIEVDQYWEGIATYFYKQDEKYVPIIVSAEDFEEKQTEHTTLYLNCSAHKLTSESVKAGKYWVNAKNQYYGTKAFATEISKEDFSLVPTWTVKGPVTPEFTKDLSAEKIWATDEDPESLIVTVSNTDSSTKYAWTYTDARSQKSTLEDNTHTCTVKNEGDYQVTVSNTKNNKTVSTDSQVCRVLKPIKLTNADNEGVRGIDIVDNSGGNLVAVPTLTLQDYETESYSWSIAGQDDVVISTEATCKATQSQTTYKVSYTITKGSQTKTFHDTKYIESIE